MNRRGFMQSMGIGSIGAMIPVKIKPKDKFPEQMAKQLSKHIHDR